MPRNGHQASYMPRQQAVQIIGQATRDGHIWRNLRQGDNPLIRQVEAAFNADLSHWMR